jgi:hypothetical protein
MPQSSRICTGFIRCPSPLQRERRSRHTLLAEPVRLDSRLKRTSPRLRGGGYYAMLAEYPPSVPIRAALLVWENRCDPRSPCASRCQQDEVGVWCASAQLRPGVGAVGDGPTAEAAVTDLRDVLEALLAEVGPPDELTLTLDVA